MAQHFHPVDARRVQQIGALDADIVAGDAAHGEARIRAALAQADHHALEDLDAFAVAFDDALVHAHRVARLQRRNLRIGLQAFSIDSTRFMSIAPYL